MRADTPEIAFRFRERMTREELKASQHQKDDPLTHLSEDGEPASAAAAAATSSSSSAAISVPSSADKRKAPPAADAKDDTEARPNKRLRSERGSVPVFTTSSSAARLEIPGFH